jgi:hypothetical protein
MRNLVITIALPDGSTARLWCKCRFSPATLWYRIESGREHAVSDTKGGVTYDTVVNPRVVVHVTDQGPA